jgi:hypothetical protein
MGRIEKGSQRRWAGDVLSLSGLEITVWLFLGENEVRQGYMSYQRVPSFFGDYTCFPVFHGVWLGRDGIGIYASTVAVSLPVVATARRIWTKT